MVIIKSTERDLTTVYQTRRFIVGQEDDEDDFENNKNNNNQNKINNNNNNCNEELIKEINGMELNALTKMNGRMDEGWMDGGISNEGVIQGNMHKNKQQDNLHHLFENLLAPSNNEL